MSDPWNDSRTRAVVRATAEPDGLDILGQGSRAGDAQRDRYAAHLGECFAGGYLPHDEYERRRELVQTAPTTDHLNTLIRDLPPLSTPEPAHRVASGALRRVRQRTALGVAVHLAAITGSLLLATIPPAVIAENHRWAQTPVLFAPWMFMVIGGLVLFIANIVWLLRWTDRRHDWI